MFFPKHIVIDIVGRCDFQAASTELNVNVFVFNDRDDSIHERDDDVFTFKMLVFRVVRVDTHSGIAHDSLRARGSDDGVAVFTFNFIFKVEKFAMFFFINDFLIAQSGKSLRVPVNHTDTAIDKAFIIKVAEDMYDAFATHLVHCEGSAVPVA